MTGRPWLGKERIGDGVRERRGVWEAGVRAANMASRVLIADAWMRCFHEVEQVVLMMSGQG